jgi:hypothetical protein
LLGGPKGNASPVGDPTKQGVVPDANALGDTLFPGMQANPLDDGTNQMTAEMAAMTASNGLGNYDEVVKSKYGDEAFIVDTSGSQEGALDGNDVIKYLDKQTGEWKVRLVGEDFFDFESRAKTVDAANAFHEGMSSGRLKFQGDMAQQQFNPEFWEPKVIDGKQFWQVKPGVNPSDAINDVFNGGSYAIDCAASINLVLLKAKMDTIGVDKFNSNYNGLALHGWDTGVDPYGTGILQFDSDGPLDGHSGDVHNNDGSADNLRPGDFTYFRNLGVEYGSSDNQGENALYVGRDANGEPVFFGNPIGMSRGETNQYGGLSTYKSSMDPTRLSMLAR